MGAYYERQYITLRADPLRGSSGKPITNTDLEAFAKSVGAKAARAALIMIHSVLMAKRQCRLLSDILAEHSHFV
jgi:hypothetical protein